MTATTPLNGCCRTKRLLALAMLVALWTQEQVTAFQPQMLSSSRISVSSSSSSAPLHYANSVLDEEQAATPASFQQRMQTMLRPDKTVASSTTNPLVQEVSTLQEYKDAVMGQDMLVVVKFYAPWCRACRAMAPGFNALTKNNQPSNNKNIKFVQVAMNDKTVNLFKGLDVPSIPFAHVYHPNGGLVEEQRLTRTELQRFRHVLADYQQESCSLVRPTKPSSRASAGKDVSAEQDEDQVWSAENPYLPSSDEDDD